jgi:hypothetical protein
LSLRLDKTQKNIIFESYYGRHKYFVFWEFNEQIKEIHLYDIVEKGLCLKINPNLGLRASQLTYRNNVLDSSTLYSVKDNKNHTIDLSTPKTNWTYEAAFEEIGKIKPSPQQTNPLNFFQKPELFKDLKDLKDLHQKKRLSQVIKLPQSPLKAELLDLLVRHFRENPLHKFEEKMTAAQEAIRQKSLNAHYFQSFGKQEKVTEILEELLRDLGIC